MNSRKGRQAARSALDLYVAELGDVGDRVTLAQDMVTDVLLHLDLSPEWAEDFTRRALSNFLADRTAPLTN